MYWATIGSVGVPARTAHYPRAHKGRPQNCFLSYEYSGSSTRERIPGDHGTIVLLSGCGR